MQREAYEQGYCDGLREAHANLFPQSHAQRKPRSQLYSHPAYQEGFSTGLKDGAEVLIALGKTVRSQQL